FWDLLKFLGKKTVEQSRCHDLRHESLTKNYVDGSRFVNTGFYCSECYRTLNNTCTVCMAPLSFPDTGEEEMDSSDEETLELWLDAVRALRGQEQGRRLLQCIKAMIKGRRRPFRMDAQL
ncbi:hypothetical protein Nmel_018702, partial [Mimus melanotis]